MQYCRTCSYYHNNYYHHPQSAKCTNFPPSKTHEQLVHATTSASCRLNRTTAQVFTALMEKSSRAQSDASRATNYTKQLSFPKVSVIVQIYSDAVFCQFLCTSQFQCGSILADSNQQTKVVRSFSLHCGRV